jgi:uncharacterized membrane protein
MEAIAALILLLVFIFVFVLPLAALTNARQARREAERANQRLDVVSRHLAALENRLEQAQATQPVQPADPEPFPAENEKSWLGDILAARAAAAAPARLNPAPSPAPPPEAEVPAAPAWAEAEAEASTAPTPPAAVPAPRPDRAAFNWEQFLGVKMFAWVGGLALFLGICFALKYSFEHGLISPPMRILLGLVAGLGLVIGGGRFELPKYAVTVQVLCGTGVVVLYADFFAAHSFYQLLPATATFGLMALVTAAAFGLAVWLTAPVVAILGMLGGFLTPLLLSTGQDNPLGLFGYLAILDVGLTAVASRQRWSYLALLAALGTLLMQWGWVDKFFTPAKIPTALAVFIGFAWLFLAAAGRSRDLQCQSAAAAAFLPAGSAALFLLFLIVRPCPEIVTRPGLLFTCLFLVDLGVQGLVWFRREVRDAQRVSGAAVFLLLLLWTTNHLTAALLFWGLGGCLFFAALHTVYPLLLDRPQPAAASRQWGPVFPALGLVLTLVPLLQLPAAPLLIWPAMLLVNLLAIAVACCTASLGGIAVMLLLTLASLALWIGKIPATLDQTGPLLSVVGTFAGFFFLAGLYVQSRFSASPAASPTAGPNPASGIEWQQPPQLAAQIPVLGVLMPFLLLVMIVVRLPLASPLPVFGLAALLAALLLGLVCFGWPEHLVALALGSLLFVEYTWFFQRLAAGNALATLVWYLAFHAAFLLFPLLLARRLPGRRVPFLAGAWSGPAHFVVVHHLVKTFYPNGAMGLLPLAFALPHLGTLWWLWRSLDNQEPRRLSLLAWQGGVALLFITLIFPIQFDRQWLTVAWALEGAALLALFHRVPHPGLQWTGAGLLAAAFVRLALNPAVWQYYPRSETPFWNWFLYAYGVVVACLFLGARLMAPPRHQIQELNVPPLLRGLATVLIFLLLNIEIADFFSTGPYISFEFSGSFARDMTYSLVWAAFAFVLLFLGIQRRLAAARYAGIGLLSATLLKLFLHDLWSLGGLYRIGSLIGLALVLIPVSYLYQRFMAGEQAKPRP